MIETLMIPTADAGIYHIADHVGIVDITYWIRDKSWARPGTIVLRYDKDNCEIIDTPKSHFKTSIFEWNLLIQYLKSINDLGADDYVKATLQMEPIDGS